MSWTPTFWVKRKDFDNFKSSISVLADGTEAWEFTIGNTQGVVLSGGETSYGNRRLHEVLIGLPHWILNGEGEACGNCHNWGDKIELDYDKE